jgi:hypothetical protein
VEGADGCAVERAAGLDGDGGRGLVRGAAEGRELAGGLVVGGEGDEPVVAAGEGRGLVVVDGERDGVAIGALLAPALEARFASALGKMTDAQLELLEDHVVVLGYGDLTEPILTELDDRGVEFVVVTPVGDRATALGDRGFHTLVADPSDDDTLRRVHVEAARAVVAATNDDAEDALAVLTARQLNPTSPSSRASPSATTSTSSGGRGRTPSSAPPPSAAGCSWSPRSAAATPRPPPSASSTRSASK